MKDNMNCATRRGDEVVRWAGGACAQGLGEGETRGGGEGRTSTPTGTVGAAARSAESAADAPPQLPPPESTGRRHVAVRRVGAGRQYSMTGGDRARGTASRRLAR